MLMEIENSELRQKKNSTSRLTSDQTAHQQQLSVPANSLPFPEFIWGAGMECSFVPHLDIDQFKWTQHDRFWKEDFRRAREELGLKHLRYSLPWHQLEPERGKFDWSLADKRIEETDRLGIELMLDVMHFGTPTWLKQAVGDPEFPEALERFTEALVSRYRSSVKTWCPCNEPLVCALFSGDLGFWPPHARKWKGYMPVLSRVVQGVSRSIRAIRRSMPEATVLLCDASEHFKTRHQTLKNEVERRNLRRFVVMDLLTGRVDADHPMHAWLVGYGLPELDLQWFRTNPQTPDVLGLDYYPHSDWQLDQVGGVMRQRRADNPMGLFGIATQYYERYGLPLMLTETSIEGSVMNREMWLDLTIDHIARLRGQGVPMLGLIWWPLLDQIDWDGAMTHHIGKIHQVGLFKFNRQSDGTLQRASTPMIQVMRSAAESGEERVGKLETISRPSVSEEQGPPIGELFAELLGDHATIEARVERSSEKAHDHNGNGKNGNGHGSNGNGNGHGNGHGNGNGNGHGGNGNGKVLTAVGVANQLAAASSRLKELETDGASAISVSEEKSTDRYGILVFSHLRWGFVWQRPQQFLSRFAKKHPVLFVEEPFFDRPEGTEPDLQFHRVMPNVVVACPHMAPSWSTNPNLPEKLREYTRYALEEMNDIDGSFDKPLLWYYSPMDAAWSLGHFENRGIVYDSMDELSQFTGAPKSLVANEARLMQHADVVFAGGYELSLKKRERHGNVHFFGCGVEYSHFSLAQDPSTTVPPDIDFMNRPLLGWFGVVDERVDYGMVGEMARMRPDWSFAMVGPVVKVDPNLLPHSPNLFWLGQRDYQVLPNYCRAFDVCMMPFAINSATQYINPTKALEYFATGRPVISTPVLDVVRQYTGLVDVVKSAGEFVDAAERAMRNPDKDRLARATEKARQSSWEVTVKTMQDLIKSAISKNDRPSRAKVQPINEAEALNYHYQATQGS
ncbi:MAG: family 1 glycosylhydrolase [Planctomycetota bacterium]|nr:family 1 glycosylhydrolase [Planctomycetota bacterium]